ncbi:MAG TPA: Bro-N domain-containing protein [Brumimicrobium sp.]|nr:Bro-N domain-containing protein [Brumimicrobium sp.]
MSNRESTALKLFQEQSVRSYWDEDHEKWFFSIIDVVSILADNSRSRKYWNDLKRKLKDEGSELSENIGQLKMLAQDGKMRLTDVADTEQLFRLIQSIPSKKAEPFKQWLAKVGKERIDEIDDPELAFDRAMETYLKKGYSKEWINQRLKSIEVRKELTDEWDNNGVKKGREYAILTNEITKTWSGLEVKDYKKLKNLKKESLRDNMSNLELVLNMLAEASTTEISKQSKPKNFPENKIVAKKGGDVAKAARLKLEDTTGKKVASNQNAKSLANPSPNIEIEE